MQPLSAMRGLWVLPWLAACSGIQSPVRCVTDEQCPEGLVCFQDGCADPTRSLAVEIKGGSTSGLFPQDILVPQVGATQDFEIRGALTIVGSFQREKTAQVDPTLRSIYTDEVQVRANGASVLLPGVTRNYQAKFAMTDRGTFSMNVGQGRFTVTAMPTSPEVPPQTFNNVLVNPMSGSTLSFAFPSLEGSVTLAGRLIKRKTVSPAPAEEYITEAPMDLQAVDPVTQEPLSQRIETSTGRVGARGDFILIVAPRAKSLTNIELVATPRDANAATLPSRRFSLSPPFPPTLTLELGDYGDEIPNVSGRVLGVDGQPLQGATVLIEGRVGHGATFRSRMTTTDSAGEFRVNVLKPDDFFSLTVYPAAGTKSGVTSARVRVISSVGKPPTFEPAVIRCAARVAVSGRVLLPDSTPASMLSVRAVETNSSRTLPLEDVQVLTDGDGVYELNLDVGNWRIEFTPAAELPQTSRLVTVAPTTATFDGGFSPSQMFAPMTLPKGRRVAGMVTSTNSSGTPVPLPNAQVRFFRLTTIEGQAAAVLVGTGVTNGVGQYTVTLPTR